MLKSSTENKIKAAIVRYLKSKSTKFSLENLNLKEIPFDIIILKKVIYLNFRKNHLKCLPTQVKSFTLILELDISHNSFEKVPSEIRFLCSLQNLYCHHNKLSEIDREILNDLQKLEIINLSHNCLMEIPETISKCLNLKRIYCSHNKLSELPETMCHCHNLREIRVEYNCLTNIPESFGNLIKLETFIIHKNQLEYLPENISDLVNLRILDIAGNNIQTMPSEINDMNLLEFYYEANPLMKLEPVTSQQIDEVMPLSELALRTLAKELQNKNSYQHVKLKEFPVVQEMLENSGECALCGGAYRSIWIECVQFVKRNSKIKCLQSSCSDLPMRAAICSHSCFNSKEHQFYGIAHP